MGVRTVASLFKVQEQTVKLWIKNGKLKARRDGLSWIINKDDLKEFYSANGR
jgi:excisionase family DNA binding protein